VQEPFQITDIPGAW